MGYKTNKIFGDNEKVHIASPDFLNLPKMIIELPDGVQINSGEFIFADGNKATLTNTSKGVYLVTEGTYYRDMLNRPKPSRVIEAFFGKMLVHTKVFDEKGTPFVPGTAVSIEDGKFVAVDGTNTIKVGEVISRDQTWIAVAMI